MLRRRNLFHTMVVTAMLLQLLATPMLAAPLSAPSLQGTSTSNTAVVLVNSNSASYADFSHFIKPYLDNFGVSYTQLDLTKEDVGAGIQNTALIIVGHRQLDPNHAYLDATEEANIVAAVNNGTGLVNFDNDLSVGGSTPRYQFVQSIFGFGYVTPPPGSGVTFAVVTHYITERHQAGESITTVGMTLAGVTLPPSVTALATTGSQPFLAVTTHGVGRAVQWGSYEWMSHAVKGPVYGLDDLVWRSLVWAARKPFVMQGMPPFVTMRMDDVSGPLWWIHAANDYGFIPWAGIFTGDITDAEAAELSAMINDGQATAAIHAFGTSDFFYYNGGTGNWPDEVMASHYVTGTQWLASHNITTSNYVVPHYYEIGSNAFSGLQNWGVQFIGTMMDPGQPERWTTEWMMKGPYRLYESGRSDDRSHNPYYADFMTIPGHPEYNGQFFNCVTEIRDITGYEWLGSGRTSVSVATQDGTLWLKRALDSMALATLFSHEYTFIGGMSQANWRTIMQGITQNIASYNPIYVSMDYACQYVRAAYTSNITASTYDPASRIITTTLGGQTDMPTTFYVFGDQSGQIEQWLVDVPTFNGSRQVAFQIPEDVTPPIVSGVSPVNGASGVNVNSNVTASFNEPMNSATVNVNTFKLRDPSNALVPATVTYNPTDRTAALDPTSALAYSTVYTATVKGGSGGVKDLADNPLAADYAWSSTTSAATFVPPDEGPGGPILVVAAASNPFGRYYAEILRTEGMNAFTVTDISLVNATMLASYDVVILGEMYLTPAQVSMFTNWVNTGGNLIAMRPDKKLASLLGLTDAGSVLSDAYLLVNTSSVPGAGIVGQTIQFHGSADKYVLNGASSIATLYSTVYTATVNPAVTLRSVGAQGGQAAAFTYDLARSVVYTRQGNPAWAGQERDGTSPIRADDLFYGASSSDPQPDWVDLNKVAIPQADEQQRLLANLILYMNSDRKPLPRFWYWPSGHKAVVIMTGDDHGSVGGGGTAERFEQYKTASPSGCSVEDWECIRSSAYIYVDSVMTDTQAAAYIAEGFEVALHVDTGCENYPPSSLVTNYSDQLSSFAVAYPSVPSPSSERTHCVVWSDWVTQPQVQLSHGIRLDTNYYFWPPDWVANRPGLFTGSGMPMRFANLDGTLIDVYQAVTQMTDESGQSYPYTIDTLLDRALGPEGYYGAFTANMHSEVAYSAGADAIVASAKVRGVPIVSSRQMLQWLDGRNGSSFRDLTWNSNTLSFTITVGAGANNLQAMLPMASNNSTLTSLHRDGIPVSYTAQTIKGVGYAAFAASAGAYQAIYALDTTPPVISNVTAIPGTGGVATIRWTTNEPSNSRVDYGTSPALLSLNATNAALVTSHVITLTGLMPNMIYYYRVTSADAASNAATYPAAGAPLSFVVPLASLVDTTVSDFGAGTAGACIYIAQTADGEVMLAPTVGAEFFGTSLPTGWFTSTWDQTGNVIVGGGMLTVNGSLVRTDAPYGSGHSLEFVANLQANTSQHIGFGTDLTLAPWAIFSTGYPGGTILKARTYNGVSSAETDLSVSLGAPHRYRIEWTDSGVIYYVDGVQVASHSIAIVDNMRLAISDLTGGAVLTVDWLRLSPYAASCEFVSRVMDAGDTVIWFNLYGTVRQPSDTSIILETRSGSVPSPDGSWSGWAPVNGSVIASPVGRYIQYRAVLNTTNLSVSPEVQEVRITFGVQADLQIAKSDSLDPVVAGNPLTYTITVTNNGPLEATNVTLTDTLPAGVTFISSVPGLPTCTQSSGKLVCNLGDLAHGSSVVVTIPVSVNLSTVGPLSNTAQVASSRADPVSGNNAVTEYTAVIHVPVAVDDNRSTAEDTTLNVTAPGVLENDIDLDGPPLTAVRVAGPTSGTLTLNADGSFVYTPTANWNGADTFTYKVNDGTFDSNVATVTITVNAVNDTPVAANDGYSTKTDTPLTVAAPGVLENDTDVEANPLTAVWVAGPAHGTLTLNVNGSFVYTPTANYGGPDTFTYKANDGMADSNVATVAIAVGVRIYIPIVAKNSVPALALDYWPSR